MHHPTKATVQQLIKRLRHYPAHYVLNGRRQRTLLSVAADMIEQLAAVPTVRWDERDETDAAEMDTIRLHPTNEYHADFGNCLFFHFDNFEGPPDVYCGSPLEIYPPFEVKYWTHFVRFNFNSVIDTVLRSAAAPNPDAQ